MLKYELQPTAFWETWTNVKLGQRSDRLFCSNCGRYCYKSNKAKFKEWGNKDISSRIRFLSQKTGQAKRSWYTHTVTNSIETHGAILSLFPGSFSRCISSFDLRWALYHFSSIRKVYFYFYFKIYIQISFSFEFCSLRLSLTVAA